MALESLTKGRRLAKRGSTCCGHQASCRFVTYHFT